MIEEKAKDLGWVVMRNGEITPVVAIDRKARRVRTSSGKWIKYRRLYEGC